MVESGTSGAQAIPIVDHDAVAAYVQQLTSCYSHLANFYFNRCKEIVIYVFCDVFLLRFGGLMVAVKLKSGPEKVCTDYYWF